MSPEALAQRLVNALNYIKIPALTIIFVIAMIQTTSAAFIGGQDKKSLFSHILIFVMLASVVFYSDQLVRWIANFVGR